MEKEEVIKLINEINQEFNKEYIQSCEDFNKSIAYANDYLHSRIDQNDRVRVRVRVRNSNKTTNLI